jgi:hypothetical protein
LTFRVLDTGAVGDLAFDPVGRAHKGADRITVILDWLEMSFSSDSGRAIDVWFDR